MECPNCHYSNSEGSKFCANCGTRLNNTEPEVKGTDGYESMNSSADASIESALADSIEKMKEFKEQNFSDEEDDQDQTSGNSELDETFNVLKDDEDTQEKKDYESPNQWYYSASGVTMGPYTEEDMAVFITNSTLQPTTYVWRTRMDGWKMLKDTELAKYIQPVTPQPEPVYEEWYYARNGQSYGPYSKEQMIGMIRAGSLHRDDYVWKDGMPDWILASQSELASNFAGQNYGGYSSGNTGNNQNYAYGPRLQQRQIFLYILLTIVSCGLFGLYWMYAIAQDINTLAARNGRPQGPEPLLALLLSIFTCSLYSFYFYWKEGNVVASIDVNGYRPSDNSILYLLLAIVGLPVVALAILQDQVNGLIARGA